MAKKTKTTKATTESNGNLSFQDAVKADELPKYVRSEYPELFKATEHVALQMETVRPTEVRRISGLVRAVVANAAKRRRAETVDFRAQERLKASEERLAKAKAKHEALVKSLSA